MSYETHSNLPDIEDPEIVLWRYVDLYKWLDLLQTSELHLTRADEMEDRWEGAFSKVNVAVRPSLYGEHWDKMASAISNLYAHNRTHVYLNCWYLGTDESAAMWSIYNAAGKGVAVRTTAGRLKDSLVGTHEPPVSGAVVQYVDYRKTFIPEGNMFSPFIYKRASFSHESEYRLLTMWSPKVLEMDENKVATRVEPDIPPVFLREAVDLDRLVEAVYVSPDAPDWEARVVHRATYKYMPNVDIRHSDLSADPVLLISER